MSSIPLHLSRRFTTSEMQEIIDVATRKSPASIEDSEPSLSELQDRLDTLWEKQLHLLDQYDQAQRQLQRHLSSGFFSLAQANFKAPSRVRYGRDYYDERMRATRQYKVSSHKGQPMLELRGVEEEEDKTSQDTSETSAPQSSKDADQILQELTPPATPLHQSDPNQHEKDSEPASDDTPDDEPSKKTKKSSDPVHWYGILVPPQLRQSQSSFVTIVEGPMLEAANSAQALRRGEVEIRKLRKDIKRAERNAVVA